MIYKASEDRRSLHEQMLDGWLIKWHPKMRSFYSYDPNNREF